MVRLKPCFSWVLLVITILYKGACIAADCGNGVVSTIDVAQDGTKQFRSLQQAINSVPSGNSGWVRIFVFKGYYKEKVEIPKDKGCIYIEGEVEGETTIAWGDHDSVTTCATFTAFSDNIAAKNIVFENRYILEENPEAPKQQAVAVRLEGDKYSFYKCKFLGIQDTLLDARGRHYFKQCYILGNTDFIWGSGQSIYEVSVSPHEGCLLNASQHIMPGKPKGIGTITAQGRNSESETNGFVFKWCKVVGGRMLLGRAYRPYSRVIFFQSRLPKTVRPRGWDAWDNQGHEDTITYVEAHNNGKGANTEHRVPWMKKMNDDELNQFVNLSYIDQEGWIPKLPAGSLG